MTIVLINLKTSKAAAVVTFPVVTFVMQIMAWSVNNDKRNVISVKTTMKITSQMSYDPRS